MTNSKNRVSGRSKILEVLSKHPEGLNNSKIREKVSSEVAISAEHLSSVLAVLAREGKIKNEGKHECPHCCFRSVLYKIKPSIS